VFVLALVFCALGVLSAGDQLNVLSAKERAEGWQLLFDGKSMANWIDPSKSNPPGDAWTIEDGCLKAKPHPLLDEDLVSQDTYSDFDLQWDWKIEPGGNSGVKYRIQQLVPLTRETVKPGLKKFEDNMRWAMDHPVAGARSHLKPGDRGQIYVVGFEYQMIDDNGHPDAKHGPAYQTGALYSILGPTNAQPKPIGSFNHSELIVHGKHVEHWLNGNKVVDTTLDTQALKDNLAHRWGADSKVYDLLVNQPVKSCHISLQNHGNNAWFRNIKIKRL
jgi:hypothetical protein